MNGERAAGLFRHTFQDWLGHNCMRLAASLAYYSLMSLAPLLVIAVGIGGAVLGRSAAQGRVISEVTKAVGPGAAGVIKSMIEAHHPGGLRLATIVSGIILLLGASGVFTELKADLNTVWDVPARNRKTGVWAWVKTRLLAFLMVLVIGALLLGMLLITPVLNIVLRTAASVTPFASSLLRVGDVAVTVVVVTILFGLIFKLLPDIRVSWKDVATGALVTAVLFTLGKFALGYYLSHSAVASSYGAAGSVVSILIFTYYSWLLLLLGAEFTETYARSYGSQAHEAAPPGPYGHPRAGRPSTTGEMRQSAARPLPHVNREGHSMPTQSEVEYLQQQADAAKTAVHMKMGELKAHARKLANPVAWARQYPKTTAAVVGGAGLAAGALLLSRRKRRKAGRGRGEVFPSRAKAKAERAAAAAAERRERRGLLAAVMAAAAGAMAPLIKAALQTAITSAVSAKAAGAAAAPEPAETQQRQG